MVYTNNYYNITAPLLLLKNKYTIIKNNIYINTTFTLIYSKNRTTVISTIGDRLHIVDRK